MTAEASIGTRRGLNSGTFGPLRYPPYRLLVSGRAINLLGTSIASLALGFAVLDLNGSLVDVGYIVAVRMTFVIIFILFGGVVADRLPRNLIMVGSNVVAGLSQAIAAVLFLTEHATVPILLALASINGITSALSQPAAAAITPQTVPSTMRKQANALTRLATNAVNVSSLAVAGILVAVIGSGWCVAFDAATFFMSALLFALIKVPAAAPDDADKGKPKPPPFVASLREGWRVFIGHTWLWVVVVGFMFYNAATAGGIGVLGLHFADLTVGRKLWGVVLAAQTVGAIFGALLVMRVRVKRFLAFGTASIACGALLPFALVFAPDFTVLLVAAFLGGVGREQFGVAWETTMQDNIDSDMLSRVYSYDMLGSFLAIPIGQLAVGPASNTYGSRTTMLAVGVVMVLAIVFMLSSRSVRQIRHAVPSEPIADVPVVVAAQPEPVAVESGLTA